MVIMELFTPVTMSLRRPAGTNARLDGGGVNYNGPPAMQCGSGAKEEGGDDNNNNGSVWPLRRVSRSGKVGHGNADFRCGVDIMERWGQCELGWTTTSMPATRKGSRFLLSARTLGVWISNPLQVVRVERAYRSGWLPRRPGRRRKCMRVASRTLQGHLLAGEEVFELEQKKDGSVWYTISSVSQPCHVLSIVGYPLLFLQQTRFLNSSVRSVRTTIASTRAKSTR